MKFLAKLIGYKPGIIKNHLQLGWYIFLVMILLVILLSVVINVFGPMHEFLR